MQNATVTYNDAWQNCLSKLKAAISADEFAQWFLPIVPIEFDGSCLKLRIPSRDFGVQIDTKYMRILRPAIEQAFGSDTKLCYAIPKSNIQIPVAGESDATASQHHFSTQNSTTISNPFVIPGLKKIVIDPQLNPAYTFANFIEGPNNRLARSSSMSVAITPGNDTPFNPLYIYGDSGLGKTHLAQAIGNEIRQRHPELQVLYVAMSKFQSQFQAATINKEIPDFIHFYQAMDVLILDDIQELSGKPGTQNAFFNIFNHLQMTGKQLILVSDKPPVELNDIEQRLLTRFKWGLSTEIGIPDFQTKLKIIRAKAERLNAFIPNDVVVYLAENITANIREIEGAISSLLANTQFLGKKITISLAKQILKVYVSLYQKEITIDHIIDVVCEQMHVDKVRLESSERTRDVAIARQLAMYLAKEHTKMPLASIGAAIGGRNHATVLHSCKTISNLMDTDRKFKAQIEEIEKMVVR